jgi:peptidoglycan/xylan/chitin deacetylase (PgdA/CDA1 family)
MFLNQGIGGHGLDAKTVCLTFDDGPGETASPGGPGPRTLELARFLAERKITATFFMIGKSVKQYPDIVREVSQRGHLVGNHTYDHADLCNRSPDSDSAVSQITRTEELFRNVPTFVRLFRPPHGAWSVSLAAELNSVDEIKSYVGPVLWDIPTSKNDAKTADWMFWRDGKSAEDCADAYILDLKTAGHGGIILMHDSLHEDLPRSRMYPLDMAKLVVDWLQKSGYEFVPLVSIPQLARAQHSS